MKKFLFSLLFLIAASHHLLALNVFAENKNIFGLHLTQPSDLTSAAPIINSSGGDWGWITIVIRLDQLNREMWQNFFDDCRRLHLIPIIRLATTFDNNNWKKPEISNIDQFASFLNSLNWPTQHRYLVLFNEINHASEWGGEIDIKNYTDIATYAAIKFKSINPDYRLLGAALDLAAPEKLPLFKSAANVYREIYLYNPGYFRYLDGLASHSYPNHGFIGKPTDTGRTSILGYRWEQDYLRNLGLSVTYPVYITETGWPHSEGLTPAKNYLPVSQATQNLSTAFGLWQKDENIVAVTPFIYNYCQEPFDHFSWLKTETVPYPEYSFFQNLPKTTNTPPQITDITVENISLPIIVFTGVDYTGKITLRNTGQSIWGENPFCLSSRASSNIQTTPLCFDAFNPPGKSLTLTFSFKIISGHNLSESYLSWEKLPLFNLNPVAGSDRIYQTPRPNIFYSTYQKIMKLLTVGR